MIFIIGGAYQGKSAFAQQKLKELGRNKNKNKNKKGLVSGEHGTIEELKKAGLAVDFQQFIRRQLARGYILSEIACQIQELLQENPGIVITMNEVGSGIVPIDKEEREYRETAGRISALLASQADEVYRVMAGLGWKIK